MDDKRLGEIAFAILKYRTRKDGIQNLNASNIKRCVENLSKRTGIPKEDLFEFGKILVLDVIEEAHKTD